ncbi:response regulator [Nitrososphaera viennensis]|uniref:Response regulator n=2 Tax=Nitrososphaera viennensis TaxID=1034015 RepID=A0A977NL19_9ARCH|nr:response regulator [Nitrososphaera viennensis]AIC16395.1 putative signal transduction response regulator, receiver domain [Nitrososphaera viennensis EN76]UVS68329.1 response regulator [Nitrososphaera viennensis]
MAGGSINKKAKKILIVDDDANIVELTRLIMESAGYQCSVLTRGMECVSHLEENNNYDLVLLDVAMPSFCGIDVVNALKEKGIFEKQKIAFFTASSAGILEDSELTKLGVIGLLKKPFSKKNLLERIEVWTSD